MIRKEMMNMYLDKYNVIYDNKRGLYSKLFFIANSDSEKVERIGRTYGYDECDYTILKRGLTEIFSDGDTAVVELQGEFLDGCTFLVSNTSNKNSITLTLSEHDFENLAEVDIYKDASMLIALAFKNCGLHNIKVHYRFNFTERACSLFLDGCIASDNEETALRHIGEPSYFYESSKEYRENDILLLYSPQDLNLLLDNRAKFEKILDRHQLELKGLFYSKCDIEVDVYHYIDEDSFIQSFFLPANSLCLDVAKINKDPDNYECIDDSPERAMEAVKDLCKEFDVVPNFYSGLDFTPIGKGRTFLKENEDFIFLKGFSKSSLLFPDMHKYPKRYLGNFKKNVTVFHDGWEVQSKYELYSYRVNNDLVHVYLYEYNEDNNTKKITRYDMNPSVFSREHVDYAIKAFNLYDPEDEEFWIQLDYDKVLKRCTETQTGQSFGESVACYISMLKALKCSCDYFVEYDEDYDTYDEYTFRAELRDFVNKNVTVQTIADEVLSESELPIYTTEPTYIKIRHIANEIVNIENKL